jgi:hypothetical protein
MDEKPDLSEEEKLLEDQREEQSLEDYFSTQESEEENTDIEEEVAEDTGEPDIYITRSGRKSKAPERLTYDAQSFLIRPGAQEQEEEWIEQDLLAFKTSTDPDTMYHHQAMKQPDKEKFQEAMKKECEAHFKEGNYKLIKKSKLPEGATLLSSVWQMKRK